MVDIRKRENTFIIPIIRGDLIERCLETIYRYTPNNFYVYIIDQTKDGIKQEIIDKYAHLYIRPYRHLGYAKAINLGVRACETKYFTMLNDDVEFINEGWWDGVMKTFDKIKDATPDRPAVLVGCASLRLPDWSIGNPAGEHHDIIPYKENYSEEDWDNLLHKDHYINERLTIKPDTVIDGVALFCSIVDRERYTKCEMLDEHFYPGGGEDYDFNCRANILGYRCVNTTLAWVFHHWSLGFKYMNEEKNIPEKIKELEWNNNHEKWGDDFDIWGKDLKIPPTLKTPL